MFFSPSQLLLIQSQLKVLYSKMWKMTKMCSTFNPRKVELKKLHSQGPLCYGSAFSFCETARNGALQDFIPVHTASESSAF